MRTDYRTYGELDRQLGDKKARKIGNNTRAERMADGKIGIRLHNTYVVLLSSGRIVLNSGGWPTATTKDRINTYLPEGWGVTQERSVWYVRYHVCTNGEGPVRLFNIPFYDGITLDADEAGRWELSAWPAELP